MAITSPNFNFSSPLHIFGRGKWFIVSECGNCTIAVVYVPLNWTPEWFSEMLAYLHDFTLHTITLQQHSENVSVQRRKVQGTSWAMEAARYRTKISTNELFNAVKLMESKNSAPGRYGIPGKVLTIAGEISHKKLMEIFNAWINTGTFPKIWNTVWCFRPNIGRSTGKNHLTVQSVS